MNHLAELLERLQHAESAYKTAKTSLDNSLEYILARETLKQARFLWLKGCEEYTKEHFFGESLVRERVWCEECQNHVDPHRPACKCDFIVSVLETIQ
jgi:hypothetical protein